MADVDEPLIGTRPQQVELGLLGARTAAVLRRIDEGFDLNEYDVSVIRRAASMLRSTADAIDFVSSSGRSGSHPQSYSFGAVALTLRVTATDTPDESVVQSLRALADDISAVAETEDAAKARNIVPLFSALACIATSSAGSPGDSIQSL